MMNEKELPVYAALDRMGIEYTRIEHPAAATMEAWTCRFTFARKTWQKSAN